MRILLFLLLSMCASVDDRPVREPTPNRAGILRSILGSSLVASCHCPLATDASAQAATKQACLEAAWKQGAKGYLPAWEEAKAWALREVWRKDYDSDYGLLAYVAGKVVKSGGGDPSPAAISQLYAKMDADASWFPGKNSQEQHGPGAVLSGVKRRSIAQSAMARKQKGVEPTYRNIVAACPQASLNPDTQRPVGKKRVYEVLRQDCYDEGAEEPWKHKARYSKIAFPVGMMEKRLAFAKHVASWKRTPTWFYNNVVWTDLCNSILPRSEKKSSEQALARKGKRGWISPGREMYSCNLAGKKETLKQNSWDSVRIWWAPVLTQGELRVVIFDDGFPGETGEGAAVMVQKVRAAINVRCQGGSRQPKYVFVDRGKGFYAPASGVITAKFRAALSEHNLEPMLGENARVEPGNLQEALLRETAVAWLRVRLAETVPAKAWTETREQYGARLKECCEAINKSYNVPGLCRDFLPRMEKLRAQEGGRLRE